MFSVFGTRVSYIWSVVTKHFVLMIYVWSTRHDFSGMMSHLRSFQNENTNTRHWVLFKDKCSRVNFFWNDVLYVVFGMKTRTVGII